YSTLHHRVEAVYDDEGRGCNRYPGAGAESIGDRHGPCPSPAPAALRQRLKLPLGKACRLARQREDAARPRGSVSSDEAGQDRAMASNAQKSHPARENYYLPGQLEAQIGEFVTYYNHLRYHKSIANLTPADVCFGHGQTILLERERIK